MKSILKKTLVVLALSPFLFSFSAKPGGEGFEIFLNDKIFTQQFGNDVNTVKSLQLAPGSAADKLTIKYYHCGRAGKNRVVTIKDEKNKVLKEFRYADASVPVNAISVPLKDILPLRSSAQNMKMYYSSTELPNGRVLLYIKFDTHSVVKL